MPRHRLSHIGSDEFLESKKIVSGRNLPIRRTHISSPVRKILGIEFTGLGRQRNRPNVLKAIAFPLKQLVISPRTARLVSPDVNDMPSPHCPDANFASWFRSLARRQIHEAATLNSWPNLISGHHYRRLFDESTRCRFDQVSALRFDRFHMGAQQHTNDG